MESSIKKVAIVTVLCSLLVISVMGLRIWSGSNRVLPGLSFEEIDQGYYCGITTRAEFVIEDNESWSDLWTDLHSTSTGYPDLPTVNFSREVVIAVFIGDFPTGGYSATITRIAFNLAGPVVYVDEVHPGEGCGETMAISQPYHIVRVELTSTQSVDFIYNVIVTNCP